MTLPVGVYLRHGIELRVDQRRPFKVHCEVCDQTLCHAGFKLDGVVLRPMAMRWACLKGRG